MHIISGIDTPKTVESNFVISSQTFRIRCLSKIVFDKKNAINLVMNLASTYLQNKYVTVNENMI